MLLFFLVVGFILVNVILNSFGLFFDPKDNKQVVVDERTSKYLFTYNYIPKNFDSILIGPSLSDIEMDTSKISKQKIYNLSLNSGNITELKILVDNLQKNMDIKKVIICLDPYIFKDSGKKTDKMTNKDFYSALGSWLNLKIYIYHLVNKLNLKYNVYADSQWGFRYNDQNINFTDEEVLKKKRRVYIDKLALTEFKELLNNLRNSNTKIYAYFYPRYYLEWNDIIYKKEYKEFIYSISKLFDSKDIVLNFNEEKYSYIHSKKENYSDSTHLSNQGANHILKEIERVLNES